MKVGFIGGGLDSAIGSAHFAAINIDRKYSLDAGMFSIDESINISSGEFYGVDKNRVYANISDFLRAEQKNLDAVIVLSPTPLHFEHVNQIFDAGMPVISEKALCTNSKDAQLLAAAKKRGEITCDVWVQVTDFDLHHMWVHSGLNGYFVASQELAYRLECHGIPTHQIIVSGIPVMPGFRSAPDRRMCAHRFGLDAHRQTILMMGGGAGVGDMETIAKKLLATNKECQLIVLAGKNEDLYQALKAIALLHPDRLFPIGFTQEVDALMACADLVITKPGGLSTSECLVMGLPMVLINPIPGQEERNAAVLLQEGVAIRADDADALLYRTQQLLANEEKFNQMKIRARALAKPDAAKVVMQHVIEYLVHAPTAKGV